MIVRTSQPPTHPFTREPSSVWEPKSEGDWWKKLPEWNASRKLNCRERAERRRRWWGSFSVRQSNKRSAEISASPLTRSDRACTGSSHLHGHTGNGPLEKRCFTGPFFSSLLQLPGQWRKEGGMFTFLSPCSAHVPVPPAAGCSRMGGRDCSPNSKHLILISLEPKEWQTLGLLHQLRPKFWLRDWVIRCGSDSCWGKNLALEGALLVSWWVFSLAWWFRSWRYHVGRFCSHSDFTICFWCFRQMCMKLLSFCSPSHVVNGTFLTCKFSGGGRGAVIRHTIHPASKAKSTMSALLLLT